MQKLRFLNFLGLIGTLLVLSLVVGCSRKNNRLDDEVLIRVDDRVVTRADFNQAFEIAKTAFADDQRPTAEDLREAKLRLLNQMAVELLLQARARDLGLTVSDAELQKAIKAIKSDYPQGQFEKSLIENAVPYEVWKKRLRVNLVMAKVIKAELEENVTISPEDVAAYYRQHYGGLEPGSATARHADNLNEIIVRQLRREKAQAAYNDWIAELKKKYAFKINNQQWERLLGSRPQTGRAPK